MDLAEKIIEGLFINGYGEKAERIALKDKEERDLGGWCTVAAISIVDRIITNHNENA